MSSTSLSTRRRSTATVALSPSELEKAVQISAACSDRNLDALVHLATSIHGLVSDDLRRVACASLCYLAVTVSNSWQGPFCSAGLQTIKSKSRGESCLHIGMKVRWHWMSTAHLSTTQRMVRFTPKTVLLRMHIRTSTRRSWSAVPGQRFDHIVTQAGVMQYSSI